MGGRLLAQAFDQSGADDQKLHGESAGQFAAFKIVTLPRLCVYRPLRVIWENTLLKQSVK
jgi:hypothetical protein